MARTNASHEVEFQQLDSEHELPPAHEHLENVGRDEGQAVAPAEASEELQKLRAEHDTLLDRLARLQVELGNTRKHAAKEQEEVREYALTDTVKSLLPILDSFEQALRHTDHVEKFCSGVELIHRQFRDALQKIGVQEIPVDVGHFDPRHEEAVEVVDTTEAEDNRVLALLQRGYKLKDRLLRPARVRVARNPKK
jgi:molecular chaperone GrpE